MTAPFQPTLVSPGPKGASTTTVNFKFVFQAFSAGETASTYALRRRKLAPTVGVNEWWDGAAWQTTIQWRTAPGSTFDGTELTVAISTGFSNGDTYEWSVQFRNAGLEISAEADPYMVAIYAAPTVAISVASPSNESRPLIRWTNTMATGRRQKRYRFAIYRDSVYTAAGFDPASTYWQTQAAWIMDDFEYSSVNFELRPEADLPTGGTWRVYAYIEDDIGATTGWVNQGFTTSFTPPAAPSVSVVQDANDLGIINLTATSAFNLLSQNQSSFDTGFEKWIGLANADVAWDAATQTLKVIRGGRSFDELNAAFASFSAEDTGAASYEVARTTNTSPTGEGWVGSSDTTIGNMVAVLPNTTYSAIATIVTPAIAFTGVCSIEWYTNVGAFISRTEGGNISVPQGVTTNVYINAATSPGTAAYARVIIKFVTATYTNFYVDSVAMARANSVQWSPGSAGVDVNFIVQKSKDGGVTWEPCWHATYDEPWPHDAQVNDTAIVKDRAAWTNTPGVTYRVYAQTFAQGSYLVSDPTVVSAPFIQTPYWYLRHVPGTLPDVKIFADSFSHEYERGTEMVTPENKDAEYSYLVATARAPVGTLSVDCFTLSREEYEALLTLLHSKDVLYIQRNIGDGFLFQVQGRIRKIQKRASDPNGNYMRHYHTVTFGGNIVSFEDAM